jgi:hypothetical protein
MRRRINVMSAVVTDELPFTSPANTLWAESNGVIPSMCRRKRVMSAVVTPLAGGVSVSRVGVTVNAPPGISIE